MTDVNIITSINFSMTLKDILEDYYVLHYIYIIDEPNKLNTKIKYIYDLFEMIKVLHGEEVIKDIIECIDLTQIKLPRKMMKPFLRLCSFAYLIELHKKFDKDVHEPTNKVKYVKAYKTFKMCDNIKELMSVKDNVFNDITPIIECDE